MKLMYRTSMRKRWGALAAFGLAALALASEPSPSVRAVTDPYVWRQRHLAVSPEARLAAGMAWDGHEVIMFGGSDPNAHRTLNDTWAWDGSSWTQKHPAHSPPMQSPGEQLVWNTHEVVLFGAYAQTWTWDGNDWTQRQPATSPSDRGAAMMAYDGHETVLYGGSTAQGYDLLGDTWTYDGANWTQQQPAHSPGQRRDGEMTYDPSHGVAILTGGTGSGDSQVRDDVWYWNGTDWLQQLSGRLGTPGLVVSDNAAMAFDGITGVLYPASFQFPTPGPADPRTFGWGGGSWQPLAADANSPPYRQWTAMARDEAHGGTVLFGGEGGDNQTTALDDTWTWGPVPPPPSPTPKPRPKPSPRPSPPPSPSPSPSPSPTSSPAVTPSPSPSPATRPPTRDGAPWFLLALVAGILLVGGGATVYLIRSRTSSGGTGSAT